MAEDASVALLIDNDTKKWKDSLVKETFSHAEAEAIFRILIKLCNNVDKSHVKMLSKWEILTKECIPHTGRHIGQIEGAAFQQQTYKWVRDQNLATLNS